MRKRQIKKMLKGAVITGKIVNKVGEPLCFAYKIQLKNKTIKLFKNKFVFKILKYCGFDISMVCNHTLFNNMERKKGLSYDSTILH